MNDTKLHEAIQEQDAYLFSWGHLEDVPAGDEKFNDLSRAIIVAFKDCHGTAFLGKLVFSWEDQKKLAHGAYSVFTEYTGQHIPAFGCNFVVPSKDAELEELVKQWAIDEWPPKLPLFTRILQRIKELGGISVDWR